MTHMKNLNFLGWLMVSQLGIFVLTSDAFAQIVPDTTLPINSAVTRMGHRHTIESGSRVGRTLFHSFRAFSVPTGQEAFFNNAGRINNIFTRVTGNQLSNIDGLLRTNGTANLFFLNPNGILFGPNARLDIAGSFFASTANGFQFGDGLEFSATNPQAPPLLTVSVPLGLQFGPQPLNDIASEGALTAGQDLTLVAGNLDLEGGVQAGRDLILEAQNSIRLGSSVQVDGDRNVLVLAAQDISVEDRVNNLLAFEPGSGELIFVADTDSNEVGAFVMQDVQDTLVTHGRDITISGASLALGHIDTTFIPLNDVFISENSGGAVFRITGPISVDSYKGASLQILAGGEVDIKTVTITGPDTSGANIIPITTSTLAHVTLSDGTQLTLDGSTQATLDIRGGVDPDAIAVPLEAIGTSLGFFAFSNSIPLPFPSNNSIASSGDISVGDVFIVDLPESLVFITNQFEPNTSLGGNITVSGIDTTVSGLVGNGGPVFLDSRGDIIVLEDSTIDTASFSGGAAGGVTVLAQENITLRKNTTLFSDGFFALDGDGIGNDLDLSAGGNITLINASLLSNSSGGDAGNISLKSDGNIEISDSSSLLSEGIGSANAGNISLSAGNEIIISESTLNSESFGMGIAGNISLKTSNKIELIENSKITSNSTGESGFSTIKIEVQEGTISLQRATISALNTNPLGLAGDIILGATEQIQISQSTIEADGGIGQILIGALPSLVPDIPVETLVHPQKILISDNSTLTTTNLVNNTPLDAQSGNINVQAVDLIRIRNSQLSVQTTSGGPAGNITIITPTLTVIDGANISATATSTATGVRG